MLLHIWFEARAALHVLRECLETSLVSVSHRDMVSRLTKQAKTLSPSPSAQRQQRSGEIGHCLSQKLKFVSVVHVILSVQSSVKPVFAGKCRASRWILNFELGKNAMYTENSTNLFGKSTGCQRDRSPS
jgi:hypothetical protein